MHRVLTICLFALCMMSCGALTAMLRRRWHVLRWLSLTAVAVFSEYVVTSALLFLVDRFSVNRTLALQLLVNLTLLIVGRMVHRKGWAMPFMEMDLKGYVAPVLLVVIALLLSGNHFGFFGMGQDEGVYQTKAIDLMNGRTERIYHFEELKELDTQDQKDVFLGAAEELLTGLYSIETHWTRDYVLALPSQINQVATPEANEGDAVYHGVPTYPAVLALFGVLGGRYGHMMDAQTVFFMLCVLILWFTAENLGLRKMVATAVCLVFVISPQIIWLSKSALTEMLHALIICTFMYLITESEYTGRRWWSAFMVTVFACLHVSIYVMLPMFLGIYWLLYFVDSDRQYIRAAVWSSLSFLIGFAFMAIVSPSYVTENLFPVCHGPVTPYNAWHFLMAGGLVSLVPSCLMPLMRKKREGIRVLDSKWANALFRGLVLLMPGLSLFYIVRALKDISLSQALQTSGFYVFIWITGLIAVPAGVVYLLAKGSRALMKTPQAAVVGMFVYAVLLMACFMKHNISYCYYYSRYLGPYIPIACVMAGIAFNHLSGKTLLLCTAVSAIVLLPFNYVLQTQDDDTYCSFDTLDKVIDGVSDQSSAVIFAIEYRDLYRQFFLPLKSIGVHCYYQEEDKMAQFAALMQKYDYLYFMGNDSSNLIPDSWLHFRLQEDVFLDDNTSNRLPFCPLPLGFNVYSQEIPIYRFRLKQAFTVENLATTGGIENGQFVLGPGELQYGPYISLPAGTYEVEVEGDNLSEVSLLASQDIGAQSLPIQVIDQANDHAIFRFSLASNANNVEFLTRDDDDEQVYVDRIILKDLRYSQ